MSPQKEWVTKYLTPLILALDANVTDVYFEKHKFEYYIFEYCIIVKYKNGDKHSVSVIGDDNLRMICLNAQELLQWIRYRNRGHLEKNEVLAPVLEDVLNRVSYEMKCNLSKI